MKIGIIVGSVRDGQAGASVGEWVLRHAQAKGGAEFELVSLKDFDLPVFSSATLPAMADKSYDSEQVQAWSRVIDDLDGYIFVTPEYNHGVPGGFKNAVDSLGSEWNGTVLGLVGYGAVGGVRAMPVVRALARKLRVDLAQVRATGPDGTVTLADVKQAAAAGTAQPSPGAQGAPTSPARGRGGPIDDGGRAAGSAADGRDRPATAPLLPPAGEGARRADEGNARSTLSASGKPMRTQSPGISAKGQPEQLKGVRRNMARVMADAHSKVVPTTLNDDADLHAWQPGNDVTVRLVRGIVRACQAVPALNAWFDGEALSRTLHPQVDIGIAVDTEEGLLVPALRNADMLDAHGIREGVNRLRQQVESRSIAASELSGYTISLSNFGMFAGRYATPVVVPPCVAIVAAGRARYQLTPVMGGVETHKVMPLSLTFDHRAATGGEAARFLRALIDDLALAN